MKDLETIIRKLVDAKAEQDNQIDLHAYENGMRALADQLRIGAVVSSKRKSNAELLNQMNNDFMEAITSSEDDNYDPVEVFREELEKKYIIIEK